MHLSEHWPWARNLVWGLNGFPPRGFTDVPNKKKPNGWRAWIKGTNFSSPVDVFFFVFLPSLKDSSEKQHGNTHTQMAKFPFPSRKKDGRESIHTLVCFICFLFSFGGATLWGFDFSRWRDPLNLARMELQTRVCLEVDGSDGSHGSWKLKYPNIAAWLARALLGNWLLSAVCASSPVDILTTETAEIRWKEKKMSWGERDAGVPSHANQRGRSNLTISNNILSALLKGSLDHCKFQVPKNFQKPNLM